MKILKLIAVLGIIGVFASCYAGFRTGPSPGLLYANEFGPIIHDQGGRIIRGTKVQGKACTSSILGLIATGDASLIEAEQNALLKAPGATKLTNVAVDFNVTNILGIYSTFCTIVTGVPLK